MVILLYILHLKYSSVQDCLTEIKLLKPSSIAVCISAVKFGITNYWETGAAGTLNSV